ncbi:hypothetical protein ABKN59_005623 [Abortiporus biennis]
MIKWTNEAYPIFTQLLNHFIRFISSFASVSRYLNDDNLYRQHSVGKAESHISQYNKDVYIVRSRNNETFSQFSHASYTCIREKQSLATIKFSPSTASFKSNHNSSLNQCDTTSGNAQNITKMAVKIPCLTLALISVQVSKQKCRGIMQDLNLHCDGGNVASALPCIQNFMYSVAKDLSTSSACVRYAYRFITLWR